MLNKSGERRYDWTRESFQYGCCPLGLRINIQTGTIRAPESCIKQGSGVARTTLKSAEKESKDSNSLSLKNQIVGYSYTDLLY